MFSLCGLCISLLFHISGKHSWEKKKAQFLEEYPNIKLRVVTPDKYRHLTEKYARKIPNWEFGG